MSLPADLKPLYAEWLQELINALNPRQEQLAATYDKARRNLLDAEGTIYYPRDLKKIKGIGDTIMRKLEKRLIGYCKEIDVEVPTPPVTKPQREVKRTSTALRLKNSELADEVLVQEGPSRKKQRKYIPKKRSGGYGILLALLEGNATARGISKDDAIELAQKYCNSSMKPNYMTKELRGAWSSIKSLIKHELVIEQGRPKIYLLTDEGQAMAETLKLADNITFPAEKGKAASSSDLPASADPEISANLQDLFGGDLPGNRSKPGIHSSSLMDVTFQDINVTPTHRQSRISHARTLAISTPVTRRISNAGSVASNDGSPSDDRILKRRFGGVRYELWRKGSYEVYPLIDYREVKSRSDREFFSNALGRKGTKCEIRQLALGDILWIGKSKTTGTECILNTIIERKRLDDLAISIRDNRFMEQKSRLEKSGCRNKYYLIEETMSKSMDGMTEALKTALWVILVYYRFSMMRTNNADDTVEKLQALQTVIQKEYSEKSLIVISPNDLRNQDDYLKVLDDFRSEFEKSSDIECCHTYQCFQEILGKGELNTVGELTIRILMFIKGVSIEKAVAIQRIFPTLSHILKAYGECQSELDSKLLMFNKLGDAPGAKKITKGLSEKIADVFSTF